METQILALTGLFFGMLYGYNASERDIPLKIFCPCMLCLALVFGLARLVI